METRFEKTHLPCPCGDSSNAYAENEDGSGKCFSCGKFFPGERRQIDMSNEDYNFQYLPWRGVNKHVMERYRVATSVAPDGTPKSIGFRYANGATKVRNLETKNFAFKGDGKGPMLFGMDTFPAKGGDLIITEGELDAMSMFQATGVASVSIAHGAATALADIKGCIDYVHSFDRIHICFDQDEAGQKAFNSVSSLIDPTKLHVVSLGQYKDANEVLLSDPSKLKIFFSQSKKFTPNNIIFSFADLEKSLNERPKDALATYPFKQLQSMTYGLRGGEAVLFKAPEGIGKTEIIRAIEAHVLGTTDHNIGIIHLEENKNRTVKGLASYILNKPCHLPDSFVTNEEVMGAYKALVKRDERCFIYSHFGSDDPDAVLNTIRFLVAACGCKFIFLDHISILVSGNANDDERQILDYMSTRLKMLAEELDFCLVFISHVNDDGQTRGSRNISKVADLVVSIWRNLLGESEDERNTTYLTVEKNRFGSDTGPGGKLFFNKQAFQIMDM